MTPARTLDLILPAPRNATGPDDQLRGSPVKRHAGLSCDVSETVGRSDRAEPYVTDSDFRRRDQLRELVERYQPPVEPFEDEMHRLGEVYVRLPRVFRECCPFVCWLIAKHVGDLA